MAKKKAKQVSEKDIEQRLIRSIERWPALGHRESSATTFEDEGILSLNKGVVIRLGNGQRFQLTIVEY